MAPWGFPDTFSIEQSWPAPTAKTEGWGTPNSPSWQHDEQLKKAFGAALTQHAKPFQAALTVFADTGQALWASQFWLADPVVMAAKAAHNVADKDKLLDKDTLALKLLAFADEKDPSQRFYVVEAKDRLAALKLYAEIQGYIGTKIDINASTNTVNNLMQIKFVRPDPVEEIKTIEQVEEQTEEKLPINLKLVSAR